MILSFYILICFIWALVIREKDDFEQTFQAFFATIFVTPVFGKRFYYWFAEHEIDKIRKEKECIARLEKERKYSEALRTKVTIEQENDFLKNMSKKEFPPARKKILAI
jgi:hypothetical protein